MRTRTIKRLAIKALIFLKKAAPYALAAASAAGTVAVTVEAVKEIKKNTPKVYYAKQDETIEDLEKKNEEGAIIQIVNSDIDIYKNKIAFAVKNYWKPIALCAGSLTCLAGSTFIFTKRQQQLIIATHQMESLLQRYSQAAGATAAAGGAAVANKLAPTEPPSEEMLMQDDGKVLFWDPVFNCYFRATELEFTEAAYQICIDFTRDQMALVSTFYKYLGAPPPVDEDGNGYLGWGWFVDDDFRWFDFYGEESTFLGITYTPVKTMDDGLEYREVCYYHAPMFNKNGRMLDGKGRDFYDLSWLTD